MKNVFQAQVVLSTLYETTTISIHSVERLGEYDLKQLSIIRDETSRMSDNAKVAYPFQVACRVDMQVFRSFKRMHLSEKFTAEIIGRDSSELIKRLQNCESKNAGGGVESLFPVRL